MKKRKRNNLPFGVPTLLLAAGILLAASVTADRAAADNGAEELPVPGIAAEYIPESFKDLIDTDYEYRREGRNDPFEPFVKVRDVQEETTPQEELSGMRRFEPGQLNLVAIVIRPDDRFAMVQDFVGKGYVVRKGTPIGRTGVIEAITPNKVLIRQYSFTMAGKKRYNTVELELKKEGEQGR